jgi:hypothetical protein
MKRTINFALFLLLLFAIAANASSNTIYFYGGDFDPNNPNAGGLANENDAAVPAPVVNPFYGAATYQNFSVGGAGIQVTGLFTNNLSNLSPSSAYWSICSGMSQGAGGTCFSGTVSGANFSWTPTGRSGFGYIEYKAWAKGLAVNLTPGQWWFSVVPQDPTTVGRSFNSTTFGLNSIGTQTSDLQYFDSAFFNANFDNADLWGVYPTFSSGVYDDPLEGGSAPEPSSLVLLGSGLVGIATVIHKRLSC